MRPIALRGLLEDRGQSSVEWVGLLLLVCALFLVGSGLFGGNWLASEIKCVVLSRSCDEHDLQTAYGSELARLINKYTPNLAYETGKTITLPVDFRSCRRRTCSDASLMTGSLTHTHSGERPTAFTHVVDQRDKSDALYVQYWFYYPDSTWKPKLKRVVGYHDHDWEGYQVKIAKSGRVEVRATAHHGYAGDNDAQDQLNQLPLDLPLLGKDRAWTKETRWTYITEGSHAGHIVKKPNEQAPSTPARSIRLVPIEKLTQTDRSVRFGEIVPPWAKESYRQPNGKDA